VIAFNLFEAYISSVESPCTVDSILSNLRLLPWLDIGSREFVQELHEPHAAFVHCAKLCDKLKNL
jgi:hypothetical protein